MALVMEGVDVEFYIVVVGRSNGFAPGKVSPDSVRFGVPTHPDNVNPCCIVNDVDDRVLRVMHSIRRLMLGEANDLYKLTFHPLRIHILKVFHTIPFDYAENLI